MVVIFMKYLSMVRPLRQHGWWLLLVSLLWISLARANSVAPELSLNGIPQIYPFALFSKEWIHFQKQWQGLPPTVLLLEEGRLTAINLQNHKKNIVWALEGIPQRESLLKIVDAFIEGRWSRLLIMSVGAELMIWEVSEKLALQLKWKMMLEGEIEDFSAGRSINQEWQLVVLSRSKNLKELEVNAYDLERGFQRNRWFFNSGHLAELQLMDTQGIGEFSHAFIFASQQKVGAITFSNGSSRLLFVAMPQRWDSVQLRGIRQGYQLAINAKEKSKIYELNTTFDETGDCSLYLQSRQLLCSWCLAEEEDNAVAEEGLVDPFVDVGLTTYYLK